MPQFRRQLEERANTTIIHCFGIMLWWKGPVPCDTNEAAYGVEPLLRLVVSGDGGSMRQRAAVRAQAAHERGGPD